MVNQARCFLSAHDRLVECLQRQGFGAHRIRQRPANDPSGVHISDKSCVHKAFLRAHISNVSHPQPIRARSPKFTIYQVWAKIRALGLTRCDWRSAFALAGQTSAAHQPGCLLAADVNALALQHAPHLPHAIHPVVVCMDPADLAYSLLITHYTGRRWS